MKSKVRLTDTPFFNVFLFSLFWAISIIVSKLAFNAGAHPVSFLIQSATISLILLTTYVLPLKYKELKNLPRNILGGILLANAIHFGFGAFFINSGIALTSVVNAGFLGKFATVTTIFFAWLILKEKLTQSKLVSVVIMIVGVFLVTTKGQSIVPQSGDILVLLACISFSLGNVLIRKFLKNNPVSGELVSFLRPVAGLPILLLFLLFSPLYPQQLQSVFKVNVLDLTYLPYLIGSSISSSLLTIYLNRTLKVASASYMTMMSMMTPVMVSIMALIILGESLVLIQAIGAALIILSGIATHYLKIEKQ
jgi:drug/metabolite transporter (DMT)-like permease